MGKEAFTSPISHWVYTSVPYRGDMPAERAVFALTEFSLGSHPTYDQVMAWLDAWVLNGPDVIPSEVRERYEQASRELGLAMDEYVQKRLNDNGDLDPQASLLEALRNANRSFVDACGELIVAWGPGDDWEDWNPKVPHAIEAASWAQAVSSEYVRASAVEFEVAERGLKSDTATLEVLAELAVNPDRGAQLEDFYTWLPSDYGKRIAEALERGGAYAEQAWDRSGPRIGEHRREPGEPGAPGSGDVFEPGRGEPGKGEPGGEPGGGGFEPGRGGFEPGGGEVLRGEPGR